MSQFFQIHPDNPQIRLINQAADIMRKGGLVVIPTDSAYALACHLDDKKAVDRIKHLRQLNDKHNFTLMCRDLTDISTYAKVDNTAYRLLKNHTPGPFTFILNATTEVPRRLMHPKRRTIGIRIPDNQVVAALLDELGEPIMSTSLILPNEDTPLSDPYDIRETLQHSVDLVIDGGYCGLESTTVVDMTGDEYQVTRQGLGEIDVL